MRLSARSMAIAIVLAASALPAHADSILVGTDLSTSTGGSGLCPFGSDCELLAEQFTLLSPVVIDQIKVAISGPYLFGYSGGSFSLSLGSQLGTGTAIGSDTLAFNSQGPVVTEVFDFTGLNISLVPGTYYLELSAGNVLWPFATPLTTSAGTVGSTFMCDPTIAIGNCAVSSRWQMVSGTHAFEIDGTTPVPEPSTLLLFGTGALGMLGAVHRKFLHL